MELAGIGGRFFLIAIRSRSRSTKKRPRIGQFTQFAKEARMLADRTPFIALVVEDEWLVRSEIVDELKAYGLQVLEASSGEAALNLSHMNQIVSDRKFLNSCYDQY